MRPLPAQMLRATATLNATMNSDEWAKLSGGTEITLSRVCVQRGAGLKVSTINSEVQPVAELYYDCRQSNPSGLDWLALKRAAEAHGAALRVAHEGITYTITYVDELLDNLGHPHHYRMEMQ